MKPTVLVTDGDQRAALAIVRSLGQAGYPVNVVATRIPSLAGASRWARSQHQLPDPLTRPDAFLDSLSVLVSETGAVLLIPVSEASLLAVLGARRRFGGVTVPFPDLDAFRRVSDKQAVLEAAGTLGIAVPDQVTVESPEEAAGLALSGLRFPMVLKPARSVAGAAKHGVVHLASPEGVQAAVNRLPREAFPLLLQQRIVGPGVGIFLLVHDGETRAVFSHRRLREKPPSGGVSVYRESIPADPELVRRSRALLDALQFEGVAMVEYKVDAATGTPYLMEINGRFWGSLQLAIDAGVDFPRSLAELGLGRAPGVVPSYRAGVRSRWWWGDVDQLLARLLKPKSRLSLPPDAPGRLRAILDFLVLWRPGDRSEVLRWSDPQPFVRESLDWFVGR